MRDCEKQQATNESQCQNLQIFHQDDINSYKPYEHHDDPHTVDSPLHRNPDAPRAVPIMPPQKPGRMGFSSIVASLFIVAVVIALGIWVFYAYRNPHTTSGQMLIRYRPSQWRWRRGEARYTAATIHM